MAHGENGLLDAKRGALLKDRIEERDEHGQALKREALGAEIARLNDLLEDICANKLGENVGLIDGGRMLLDLRLQPLPSLVVRDMHELGSDVAAVIAARFSGAFAFWRRDRERFRRQVLAERIERCL